MSNTKHKTREAWLMAATKKLAPVFKKMGDGAVIPDKVMVGCGWPRGGKAEVIGQCFGKSWTADGVTHIFISPTQGDVIEVLAVLVHELVHATLGEGKGHGKEFKKLARAVGLEGKLTATVVTKTSLLHPILVKIAEELGEYPHSKMIPKMGLGKKKKDCGWCRLYSTTIPKYSLTMTISHFEEHGVPLDPNGEQMVRDEEEAA